MVRERTCVRIRSFCIETEPLDPATLTYVP